MLCYMVAECGILSLRPSGTCIHTHRSSAQSQWHICFVQGWDRNQVLKQFDSPTLNNYCCNQYLSIKKQTCNFNPVLFPALVPSSKGLFAVGLLAELSIGNWKSKQLRKSRLRRKAGSAVLEKYIYRSEGTLFFLEIDGTQHVIKCKKEVTPLMTSALSQDMKPGENIKLCLKSPKQATMPMWLSQQKG